jgi:hypothetical protein
MNIGSDDLTQDFKHSYDNYKALQMYECNAALKFLEETLLSKSHLHELLVHMKASGKFFVIHNDGFQRKK